MWHAEGEWGENKWSIMIIDESPIKVLFLCCCQFLFVVILLLHVFSAASACEAVQVTSLSVDCLCSSGFVLAASCQSGALSCCDASRWKCLSGWFLDFHENMMTSVHVELGPPGTCPSSCRCETKLKNFYLSCGLNSPQQHDEMVITGSLLWLIHEW